MRTCHCRLVAGITGPVHGVNRLGSKPHQQLATAYRKRHRHQSARDRCQIQRGWIQQPQCIGRKQRRCDQLEFRARQQPVGERFQSRFVGGVAGHPPLPMIVDGGAIRINAIQQRRCAGTRCSGEPFLNHARHQRLMGFANRHLILQVFAGLHGAVMQRQHLGQQFTRGPQLVGHCAYTGIVMTGNQPPQFFATSHGHREARGHPHILQIFCIHF